MSRLDKRITKEKRTKEVLALKRELYKLYSVRRDSGEYIKLEEPVFAGWEMTYKLSRKGEVSRYRNIYEFVIENLVAPARCSDKTFRKKEKEIAPKIQHSFPKDLKSMFKKGMIKSILSNQDLEILASFYIKEIVDGRVVYRFTKMQAFIPDLKKVYITHRYIPNNEIESRIHYLESLRELASYSGYAKTLGYSYSRWQDDDNLFERRFGFSFKHTKEYWDSLKDD